MERLHGLGNSWLVIGMVVGLGMCGGVGTVAASGVPDEVIVKIEQELRDSQMQVHILGQNQAAQGHENGLVGDDTYTLGEGYRYYVLDGIAIEQLGRQADEQRVSADQVLDMAGYVFTTQYRGQDQSLIYASTPPTYDAITTISTSEGFSDEDFTRPLRHAISWGGDAEDGKLIDDKRTGIQAFVADVDGQQRVMLIQNSMLLEMKQFDTLTLTEFVHRLWSVEQERADSQHALENGSNHNTASEMSGVVGASVNMEKDHSGKADNRILWSGVAVGVIILGIAGWFVVRRQK